MPTRQLPNDRPSNISGNKPSACEKASMAGDADALAQVRAHHPRGGEALTGFSLSDAQLVTARLYGFPTWTQLKRHLAVIEPFVWNPPPILPAARSRSSMCSCDWRA